LKVIRFTIAPFGEFAGKINRVKLSYQPNGAANAKLMPHEYRLRRRET
jgi:hypothetical protein